MERSEIRSRARETLRGNFWQAVLVAFVAAIFGSLPAGGSFSINVDEEWLERLPELVKLLLSVFVGTAGVLNLVHLILGGVVQLGYAQYLLKQQDRVACGVEDLFSQFERFKQGFLQLFLRQLYTALWSLLFVIPGIVKSYSYAMTPYIMAENPTLTAKEAIALSKEMMDGHKMELFLLELSFIGWSLLCALTLGIGTFFLNPYINTAHAIFYRSISRPAVTAESIEE